MLVGDTDTPWACTGRKGRKRKAAPAATLARNAGLIRPIVGRSRLNSDKIHAWTRRFDDSSTGARKGTRALAVPFFEDDVPSNTGKRLAVPDIHAADESVWARGATFRENCITGRVRRAQACVGSWVAGASICILLARISPAFSRKRPETQFFTGARGVSLVHLF